MSGFQVTMVSDGCTHAHTDGQTWVYKTFSAKAGVPKKINKIKQKQKNWPKTWWR